MPGDLPMPDVYSRTSSSTSTMTASGSSSAPASSDKTSVSVLQELCCQKLKKTVYCGNYSILLFFTFRLSQGIVSLRSSISFNDRLEG